MSEMAALPMEEHAEEEALAILCVDDEANILSALRRLFRATGQRVTVAGSGQEALAVMEREPVDLVVSDMRMPGMSGAQLLAAVRARWPDTVRILLTGYADLPSTVDAVNLGQIHRYVAKPWDDEELLRVVREALERKLLLREKARLEALTLRQNEELKALNATLEAKVAARTAELREAHERLKAGFVNTVRTFSNLVELVGGHMAGHSRRVAEHARRMAQALQLPAAESQEVLLAALLHDIGKVGLAEALIAKPFNHLTADERHEVYKHPAKAEALLMGMEPLRGAARLIRSHHEHFDGTGFPDRLSGMAIPLGARILAVANDYDALQQGSISRRRATPQEALDFVRAARGRRYDPAVVTAFEHCLAPAQQRELGRSIGSDELEPGMVVARDLLTREGVMLLARDYVINDNLIRQIRSFEASEGYRLAIEVVEGTP